MTHDFLRTVTAVGAGLAGCLLIASCSSSSTPAPAASPVVVTSVAANSSSVSNSPGPDSSAPERPTSSDSSSSADAGDTSSPTSAAKSGTACSLVTEQDVTVALGADPGPGSEAVRAKGSTCAYGGTSKFSVNVAMVPAGGKAAYDSAKSMAPTASDVAVDVPGIGDAAFGIFHPPFASIEFYKGETFVSILVSSTIGDISVNPKDQALAIAKVAVGRA